MRFSIAVFAVLAAAGVQAAAPKNNWAGVLMKRDYPACALPCVENADLDGCGATDYSCLCTDHKFLDSTTQCIYNACTNPADLKQAFDTAQAACAAAGFTITSTYTPTQSLPQTGSATSTGGAATTTSGSPAASSGTGSSTGTGAPQTTTPATSPAGSSSSPAPTTSKSGAGLTAGVSSGVFGFVGAALFAALAL